MMRLSFAGGTPLLALVVAHMVLAVHGQASNALSRLAGAKPPSPTTGSGSGVMKITLARPSNLPTSFSSTPYGIRYVKFGDYEYDPEVVGAYSRFDIDTMKDGTLGVTHIEEINAETGEPLPPSPQYFLVYDLSNINIRVDGRYCNVTTEGHCVCYSAKMKNVAGDTKKLATKKCGEEMSYICWRNGKAVYPGKDGEVEVKQPTGLPAPANAIVLHFDIQGRPPQQTTKLVWWTDKNDEQDKDGIKTKTCSVITDKLPKLRLAKTYLYGRKDAVNSVVMKFPGCSTIEHNGCYFGNKLVKSAEDGNLTQAYEELVDVEVHPPQADFEDGSDAYEQVHQCDAEANMCCKLEDDDTDPSSGCGASGIMMALVAAAALLPLL
ncbi:hypothetical protein AAVH_05733 [Aphelenchoides avenae]|nr:hypothetical protein AAVH_05733 [Aphelenchus avenae]